VNANNSLSNQRSEQPAIKPALVLSLYQVTEGFHFFTDVMMILLFLWIGKNLDKKMQPRDCRRNA
jgi:hypothetical protein